jgi:signal-transduction protein with cAMP-binding, CBS, and nucleotidyltransferase domain
MQAESFPLPLVMRRPLVALHVFDSVSVALDAAQEHGVHHFPVCDGDRLVGMVCTCDLQEGALESAVGELMRPAVTLPVSSSTTDAALLMRSADVGSVLVTDRDGAPCGIVTRGDLNGEPPVAAILADCRCEACGTHRHLHRYGDQQLCFSCHERAAEPQAFDTGGGD